MINTKYIILIDDSNELCDIVDKLYKNESTYEFVCTKSDRPKLREALLTVPDLIVINEDSLEDDSTINICKYIIKLGF